MTLSAYVNIFKAVVDEKNTLVAQKTELGGKINL